jgi:hypothetical protein
MRLISGMAIPLCLGFIISRAWQIDCPEIVTVAVAGLFADFILVLFGGDD